jgi:hypothetical protein
MSWQRIQRWRLFVMVLVRDTSRLAPEACPFLTSGLFLFFGDFVWNECMKYQAGLYG